MQTEIVIPGLVNQLVALLVEGRFSEAEKEAQLFVDREPTSGVAWKILGIALAVQGKPNLSALQKAAELLPQDAEVHSNFALALQELGRFDEAVSSFEQAIAIDPGFAGAHTNLGNVLRELARFDGAIACFQTALRIKPDCSGAHDNLLFTHNFLCDQSAQVLLEAAQHYGSMVAQQARAYRTWSGSIEPGRILRVGFVSGDLGDHPVGYFLESVLSALIKHTAGGIACTAYMTYPRAGTVAQRLQGLFHGWRPVAGLSDEALAKQIHDDGIDILIDLSGHTRYNRLPAFAWKPAPIQASWLGYFATTGVGEVDYWIADPWTVPAGEEGHFIETVWRLPETYLCFTEPQHDVEVGALPASKAGAITFGCFNNLPKMHDDVVALWARVLAAVPESKLFLKTKQLDEAATRQRTLERFAVHGIGAERLRLEGAAPRAELLAAYNQVDIALDPFPYPGGTTSVESLWMGVPVLSLAGDRFLSHIGESILHNAGLADWIALDRDDYVVKAKSHVSDLGKLTALRRGLRAQVLASPLFDAPRFADHFAQALRGMWVKWCEIKGGNGKPSASSRPIAPMAATTKRH